VLTVLWRFDGLDSMEYSGYLARLNLDACVKAIGLSFARFAESQLSLVTSWIGVKQVVIVALDGRRVVSLLHSGQAWVRRYG
jgi:hypothetical protein